MKVSPFSVVLALCLLPFPAWAQDDQSGTPGVTVTTPGGPAVTRQGQQGRRSRRGGQRGNANGNNRTRTRQYNPNNTARTRTNPVGGGVVGRPVNLVPGGAISSPPVFANGMLYLASWNKRVYALDAQTGVKKWATQGGGLFNASPAVGLDGTVFACCYDGSVYALNGKTGVKKWAFKTGNLLNTAPALSPHGEKIYVGGYDHVLYAIDSTSGKSLWQYKTTSAVCAPRVGSDGTVYVGADRLYAVDGQTGKPLWASTSDFSAATGIALGADGTIYAPSHDSQGQDALNAVNPKNGTVLWSVPLSVPPTAPPVAALDRVYVSAGSLLSLRAGSGRLVWQFGGNGTGGGQPAISPNGSVVVIDGGDQTLHALLPTDGTERWQFPTSDPLLSFPAFGTNGNIYAASEGESKVYCLSARDGHVVWTFTQDSVFPAATKPATRGNGNTTPRSPSKPTLP